VPVYDYECEECGHRFELRQGFDAPSETVCPRCKSRARRRFHSVGVIFKGSGWYATDYAHKNSLPAEDHHESEKPEKGHDHSTEGSREKAPEEKTGTKAKEED
jgi:putative FmdB family regulatory protein